MKLIIASTDMGRLAIEEETLTDKSKVYCVFIRGAKLPCMDGLTAANLYEHPAKEIAEGRIL